MKAHFGLFGDSGNLDADWYMVCTERTIGSEIILEAQIVLQGDEAQVEGCFGLFRDSASLDAR